VLFQVANGGKSISFATESTQTFQIEFQYEPIKGVMDRQFVLQASVSDNYVPAIVSPSFRVVYVLALKFWVQSSWFLWQQGLVVIV
jgi:hypothetical protein